MGSAPRAGERRRRFQQHARIGRRPRAERQHRLVARLLARDLCFARRHPGGRMEPIAGHRHARDEMAQWIERHQMGDLATARSRVVPPSRLRRREEDRGPEDAGGHRRGDGGARQQPRRSPETKPCREDHPPRAATPNRSSRRPTVQAGRLERARVSASAAASTPISHATIRTERTPSAAARRQEDRLPVRIERGHRHARFNTTRQRIHA